MNRLYTQDPGLSPICTQDLAFQDVSLENFPFQELTVREVYETVAASVCKVVWKTAKDVFETTGSFVQYPEEKIHVLTSFNSKVPLSEEIEIVFGEKSFKGASLHASLQINLAQSRDLALLQVPGLEIGNVPGYFTINLNPTFYPGDEIYFAGFPVGQNKPVIHKGAISSIDEKTFTIDGTVIRGNSGGPVVLSQRGKLILIGTIASQIIYQSKSFFEGGKFEPKRDSSRKFTDPDPKEGFNEIVSKAVDAILSNFSTGVGKVVCIRQLYELLQEKDETESKFFKKPIDKKEIQARLATEMLGAEQNEEKKTKPFRSKLPKFVIKKVPESKTIVDSKAFLPKELEQKKSGGFFNSFIERETIYPQNQRVLLHPTRSKVREDRNDLKKESTQLAPFFRFDSSNPSSQLPLVSKKHVSTDSQKQSDM